MIFVLLLSDFHEILQMLFTNKTPTDLNILQNYIEYSAVRPLEIQFNSGYETYLDRL